MVPEPVLLLVSDKRKLSGTVWYKKIVYNIKIAKANFKGGNVYDKFI